MGFSTTTGVYTPPTGATNAFSGKVIASAVWNSIFTDLSSALTTLAQGGVFPIGVYAVVAKAVNFNAGNTDTQIPIVLPPGHVNYRLETLYIANASQTLTTATFGLFGAAGGAGTVVIAGGTAITVSTAAANSGNNMQTVAGNSSVSLNLSTLFFRVGTAQGAPATGDVIISIRPLP